MSNLSLFSQISRILPAEKIKKIISDHRSDRHSKGFDTWSHLVSMIFCHIAQCHSLRDLSNGLRSATGNLNHFGMQRAPAKSTLSYANQFRHHRVFQQIFLCLARHFEPSFRSKNSLPVRLGRKIFALDSTVIPLCMELFDWARYTRSKGAVKLHTLLSFEGHIPVFVRITDGKVGDPEPARQMDIPSGSVLLMDRGYLDFAWFKVLDSKKVMFVTRLKTNSSITVTQERPIPENNPDLLSDENILLLGQQPGKQYPEELRLVRVKDPESDNILLLLTNNFDWKARTVADLYRQRWQIEVFFKQLKQHLRIKSFIGTSPNAVFIQIWTALISIILLKYLKKQAKYPWHLSNLVSFIRLNLFVKTDLKSWLDHPFHLRGSPKSSQLRLF